MSRYDEGFGGDRSYLPYGGGFGEPRTTPARQQRAPGAGSFPEWGPAPRANGDWLMGEAIYGPERYGLGPYHERLRRRRRPDDELAHDVMEALFFDTWVDADAIAVAVRDGVVTLTGTLPNYDEVRYAVDDVWDVEGVLGVHSDLIVEE